MNHEGVCRTAPQQDMATIKDVGQFYYEIRESVILHNFATTYFIL